MEALAIVLKLKELNPEIKIVAECLDPKNISLLKKAGCQSVVCGTVLGQMIAQEIQDPGVHEVINQLTCNSNAGQFFIVDLPKTCHSVADVQAYSVKQRFVFIALRRANGLRVLPRPSDKVHPGIKVFSLPTSVLTFESSTKTLKS